MSWERSESELAPSRTIARGRRLRDDVVVSRSIDDITRDLARVQDQLLGLASDDFSARYPLLKEQDALRHEAEAFAADWDAQRPTGELVIELAEARSRLQEETDRVSMSGIAGIGGSAGIVGGAMASLTITAKRASDLDAIKARVAKLESLLTERGVPGDAPDAAPGSSPAPGSTS